VELDHRGEELGIGVEEGGHSGGEPAGARRAGGLDGLDRLYLVDGGRRGVVR